MSKINIDLTTLSGWPSLSTGTHSITVKAKATGYRDSEASQAVSVAKSPTYDYTQEGSVVTLRNAPYTQAGSEVTII